MRKKTASRSNPDVLHLYSREHSTVLPAVLSSSFPIWFCNGKQFVVARVRKLITAGAIALVSKKWGNCLWFLMDISIEFIVTNSKLISWVCVRDKCVKSKGELKTSLGY
jgi:hypothetical protein